MRLNHQSPIPLYRQLADQILADINNGKYAVATRIPAETELATRYAIGRPTVRQATEWLVRQGRLERRRGSGTYVLPPTRSIDLFSLAGTSSALQASNLNTTLELLDGPVLEAPAPGGDNIQRFRIERLARVDRIPVMYETLRFDAALFADLDKYELAERSLSALVREVFFLEPDSASQTFFAVYAEETMAQLLAVPRDAPVLRVKRELHFGEYRRGLLADIVCRTDQFEFTQILYPAQIGGINADAVG